MATLLGISGSLRRGSFNTALLHAAESLAPDGVRLEIATLHGIPLFDGDVEREGVPDVVTALKDRIAECDGLLLATPEYNHSLPGPLKNAVDWLSRPQADQPRVFHGRPVALVGATPGPTGTRYAQTAWLPVIQNLGMRPWFGGAFYLSQARQAFDESGTLMDPDYRERLRGFLAGFAEFLGR
ncbi:NADPH-dependent FMN reductase [Thiohalorhabdus sp. Cl-TMA]|uniref:NADPH-dependent FMN reductase n=1 Tax=Thiohalorhabdus methylotrophus TaxID=3242694 RepID=A0ABV4TWV6_9GAMM